MRELGDQQNAAALLVNLGSLAMELGDLARSAAFHMQSLGLRQELGSKHGIANSLEAMATTAGAAKQPYQAARLYGAAEALRHAIDMPLHSRNRAEYEEAVAKTRAQVDVTSFEAARAAGRTLSLEAALAETAAIAEEVTAAARSEQRAPSVPPQPAPATYDLSPREFDVLRLLVAERTDREIAAVLSVSRKTASHHVSAILRKLDVETRAGAVRRAVAERLVDAATDRA